MKTLNELNANPHRWTWGEYTVEDTYAVGGMGRSWSATHSGAKFHLLHLHTIVERDEAACAAKQAEFPKYRPARLGTIYSVRASCNGNGQNTGILGHGLDTDRINCKHCLGE